MVMASFGPWRWRVAELQMGDFRQFFFELHGKQPFPWQEALAERVCADDWPDVIDLPTASGKTACIDIALFALALRRAEVPRRIFFIVDRRVVVNEAYLRMQGICKTLREATTEKLSAVRAALRALAGGDEPLHVYEMRGGAFRDETWVKSPLQPTVVASTVDQVGSRLLFRGYGVSDFSWPIHAGLIANDALIILDEAHCSRAFSQTLQRIEQYRGESWAEEPMRTPFRFVEMTATPSRDSGDFLGITEADRSDATFARRLYASKPTYLVEVKGKRDDFSNVVNELVSQAISLAKAADAKRVAIIVNRVRTAKDVYERLRGRVKESAVELVIGRMRPVDRDDLYEHQLKNLKSGVERQASGPLTFVVSTQCLEVGADLDFDVLVSECASIDALQQRFGRLNRLGDFGRARGAVVIAAWQIDPKQPDPVYGNAISRTWQWLQSVCDQNGEINMGIESIVGQPPTAPQCLKSVESAGMRMQAPDAPILLPSHVDALVQTSPVPKPDPSIALFLHGPERSVPDVQVIWRADLVEEAPETWAEIVELCPPSSREAMPVAINAFRKWFAGEKKSDDQESDLPVGMPEEMDESDRDRAIPALVWREDECEVISRAGEVQPGQTLVLPVVAGGWEELDHIPDGAPIDMGDRAAFEVRRSVPLRLHPRVMKEWQPAPALKAVVEYASQSNAEPDEMKAWLTQYGAELAAGAKQWPYQFLAHYDELRPRLNAYPLQARAYVLEGRKTTRRRSDSGRVFLDVHSGHMEKAVRELAAGLENKLKAAFEVAAKFHDYGKVDVRYQAWLLGGDRMAAQYAPKPIAKSGHVPVRSQQAVELPRGFRHELLSLLFAERAVEAKVETRDLTLHLVASHHGRCRPFAPVVPDENAECASYGGISICRQEREEKQASEIDSGVPDRFWKLTRKYGWWGLAYLEALFRLADWSASEKEGTEVGE